MKNFDHNHEPNTRNSLSSIRFEIKQEAIITEDTSMSASSNNNKNNNNKNSAGVSSTVSNGACHTQEEASKKMFGLQKRVETLTLEVERMLKVDEAKSAKIKQLEEEQIESRKLNEKALREIFRLKEENRVLKKRLTEPVSVKSQPLPQRQIAPKRKTKSTNISAIETTVKKPKNNETESDNDSIIVIDHDSNNKDASHVENAKTPSVSTVNEIPRYGSKIDLKFKFPSAVPLNTEIWSGLENNVENNIILTELNELEKKEECKRLTDYSTNLIINVFNRKITFDRISKTDNGYAVDLKCSEHVTDCESFWFIQINVATHEVNAVCDQPCNHLFSTGQKRAEKTEVEFELMTVLDADIWHSLENNQNRKLPHFSQLAKEQSDELERISEALKEHLISLGIRTFHHNITKTHTGYTFRRQCNFKDCSSSALFKIKITDKKGKISINEDCKQHRHV